MVLTKVLETRDEDIGQPESGERIVRKFMIFPKILKDVKRGPGFVYISQRREWAAEFEGAWAGYKWVDREFLDVNTNKTYNYARPDSGN
jgi:hypothetical protein